VCDPPAGPPDAPAEPSPLAGIDPRDLERFAESLARLLAAHWRRTEAERRAAGPQP
jgi:hypothetical protein